MGFLGGVGCRLIRYMGGVVFGWLRFVGGQVWRAIAFAGRVTWWPFGLAGRVICWPFSLAGRVILCVLAFAGKHGTYLVNHSFLWPYFGNPVVSRENGTEFRGIEGSNNSCYMDSSLNSMFLFNEEFSHVLKKKDGPQKEKGFEAVVQMENGETVKEILREKIVEPLQTSKSLRLNERAMFTFRSHLSKYKNSYSWDQMDCEEFISTLFGTILETKGFYFIEGDSEGSHVFQTYADMTKPTNKIDVQTLLEYFFKESKIQLASIPYPGFIIKMPVTDGRHMFNQIYPNPKIKLRKILKPGSEFEPEMLLSAVICLCNNHFTSFVREGKDKTSSSWWYLDSFSHTNAEYIQNLDKCLEDLDCSQQHPRLKFLIENCYICFYSPVNS